LLYSASTSKVFEPRPISYYPILKLYHDSPRIEMLPSCYLYISSSSSANPQPCLARPDLTPHPALLQTDLFPTSLQNKKNRFIKGTYPKDLRLRLTRLASSSQSVAGVGERDASEPRELRESDRSSVLYLTHLSMQAFIQLLRENLLSGKLEHIRREGRLWTYRSGLVVISIAALAVCGCEAVKDFFIHFLFQEFICWQGSVYTLK
jgi:hypothetical protein